MNDPVRISPHVGALLFWVCICLLLASFSGTLSSSLLEVWLVNVLPYFMLSLAAGIVISCGQIDISTGGVMSLAGMVIVACLPLLGTTTTSVVLAHAIAATLVLLVYLVYAVVASRGISTLIATLSVLLIAKGASTLIQSCLQGVGELCRTSFVTGQGSSVLPEWAIADWAGHPAATATAYISLVLAAMGWRYRSRWGLEHIAVGMDATASRFCRVPIGGIRTRAFLMAGALVAFATLARLHGPARGGWSANVGWGDELLAIAMAVIGGTRISGGRLNPIGILLASFGVYISRDIIINDLGVPAEVASLLFGALLFIVITLDMKHRKVVGDQRG
ncbi:MAG: hypothetical protein WAP57_08470 [Aquabacterium commune]|uniref:ABC transporter permease n=1 Tax=Aquabacterium commune TaxID=70586 RepID=UPI003BAE7714